MRHSAIRSLRIDPGLQPVEIQRRNPGHFLKGQGRGIAVAAITQALDIGAVHHITVESQVVQGVGNHVMDRIQLGVRRGESTGLAEVRTHPVRLQALELRSLRQAVQDDIAEHMMVEAVRETVAFRCARRDIFIAGVDFPRAIRHDMVREGCDRTVAGRKRGQPKVRHGVEDAAEVHDPSAFAFLRHADSLHRLLDAARLAHLRRGDDAFDTHDRNRAPFQLVQILFPYRLGSDTGVDHFSPEMARFPGVIVPVAAPGAFPGSVRTKTDRRRIIPDQVQLCLDQRALEYGFEGILLIPT